MDYTRLVREAFSSASRVPDDDVIEELAQHAEALYEAARADGCPDDEARARVAVQITHWCANAGKLRRLRRRATAAPDPPAGSSSPLAGLAQDARYAARLLRRHPRHAVLTIAITALAIGASTTMFSATYGVLAKPLPWPHGDRIVELRETRGGSAPRFGTFSSAVYLAWRESPATIDGIAAWTSQQVILSGAGEPERIRVTAATASLFQVLGVRPLLGRFFDPAAGPSTAIVISESLWRARFGGDPGVIDRFVAIDGQPCRIVAVIADGSAYPDRESRGVVPLSVPTAEGSQLAMFNAIATLRQGATASQAAAEGTARGRSAAGAGLTATAIFGSSGPADVHARLLRDALTADVRLPLIVLLIAVGLLVATATANLAGLQLARDIARRRELAIRVALGAGTARVTRQLLVESLFVSAGGGACGLVLAWGLHRLMPALLPPDFPRVDAVGVDPVVLAFAILLTAGTSLVVALVPAWQARGRDLVAALHADRTAAAGGGLRSRTGRWRTLVMTGQVAIACVLLVGASLLGRSFLGLVGAERGYHAPGVLSARISMPAVLYPSAERRFALVEQILARLAAMPDVRDASFTSELPIRPGGSTSAFTLRAPGTGGGLVRVQASPRLVGPDYFRTLRMRMVAGRGFSESDTDAAALAVVVNETFSRRYLGPSPLGSTLPLAGYGSADGEERQAIVIGIVEDVRYVPATEATQPELYYSYRQMQGRLPVQTVTLLVRTSGSPLVAAAALGSAVRESDPRLAADAILPLQDRLLATLARPRLYSVLLGGFAAAALLVACVGLFAALSYAVSQRSRELALRAALGARRSDLLRLVLGQGLAITLGGLAAGMTASVWSVRLLASQLYGVTPHDAPTFVFVPLLLLAAGMLACVLPALRAARSDPLVVLKDG